MNTNVSMVSSTSPKEAFSTMSMLLILSMSTVFFRSPACVDAEWFRCEYDGDDDECDDDGDGCSGDDDGRRQHHHQHPHQHDHHHHHHAADMLMVSMALMMRVLIVVMMLMPRTFDTLCASALPGGSLPQFPQGAVGLGGLAQFSVWGFDV